MIFSFLALNAHVDWGGKPHLKIASFQIYNDWHLIHPWWRATKCNTWIPESGNKPLNGFNMFSISLQHPTQDYFWYNDSTPISHRQGYSYLEVQGYPQRMRLQRRLENKYDESYKISGNRQYKFSKSSLKSHPFWVLVTLYIYILLSFFLLALYSI